MLLCATEQQLKNMPVAKLAICSTSTGNKNWIHIGRCVDLVRRVVHLKGLAHSFSSENKAHICLVDLLYLCIKTFSSFGFLKTRLLVCTCSLMSKRAVLFTNSFFFFCQTSGCMYMCIRTVLITCRTKIAPKIWLIWNLKTSWKKTDLHSYNWLDYNCSTLQIILRSLVRIPAGRMFSSFWVFFWYVSPCTWHSLGTKYPVVSYTRDKKRRLWVGSAQCTSQPPLPWSFIHALCVFYKIFLYESYLKNQINLSF